MLPLNDTEPNRYSPFPLVTFTLIALNCLVYYAETVLIFPSETGFFYFFLFGFSPALMFEVHGGGALANLTAMFLHADFFHLAGNMLALWVFGRRVEDACGGWRFLAFYLLAGTMGHILFAVVESDSFRPTIGASGAIFGLMGAYLLLYPTGRIRTLVLFTPLPLWPRIRAIWIVLYFLGIQIIPALEILLQDNQDYSVNYWGHLGGFFSAVFVLLFLRPEAFARYFSDTLV